MTAYYNEFDADAAAWLRELIKTGAIPDGIVDTRSIVDVEPRDLDGFAQCHFFVGIGGWSLALRLAGWADDRPVWTGSCPCQPFSAAGKQKGKEDERHLWPAFARLIRECRPDVVFGEQVTGAIGHGWLDLVQADLEAEGYAVGHCVLGAHSVGAPHIRQRLYWVADSQRDDSKRRRLDVGAAARGDGGEAREQRIRDDARPGGDALGLAVAGRERREGVGLQLQPGQPRPAGAQAGRRGEDCGVADADRGRRSGVSGCGQAGATECRDAGGMVDRFGSGLEGLCRDGCNGDESGRLVAHSSRSVAEAGGTRGMAGADGCAGGQGSAVAGRRDPRGDAEQGAGSRGGVGPAGAGSPDGGWSAADWLWCRDGAWRPVEPGTFPLADGVPARVGRLRGYGNAIVPQVAAEFVIAYMETVD